MVTSAPTPTAWLSAKAPFHQFKTRLLKDGTKQSKSVADRLAGKHMQTHTSVPFSTVDLVMFSAQRSCVRVAVLLVPRPQHWWRGG